MRKTPPDDTSNSIATTAALLRRGAVVRVRGRTAVFVKRWGSGGAVVRFEDRPREPKVVPLVRVEPT